MAASTASSSTYGAPPALYNQLVQLQAQNKLSGLPASLIAAIGTAEHNWSQGLAVNSSNAGGYFGLVVGSPYYLPGSSTPITFTKAQLIDPSTFAQQAQVAAGDFSYILNSTSGNIYTAENIYQTGNADGKTSSGAQASGAGIFQSLGVPQTLTGNWSPSNLDQGQANPLGYTDLLTGGTGSTCQQGGGWSIAGNTILSSCQLQELKGGALMLGGIIVFIVGVVLLVRGEATKALVSGLIPKGAASAAPSAPSTPSAPSEDQLDAAYSEGVLAGGGGGGGSTYRDSEGKTHVGTLIPAMGEF